MTDGPIDLEAELAERDAEIAELEASPEPADPPKLSEALLDRAFTLQMMGRIEDAVLAYEKVADRMSGVEHDAVLRDAVRALQQRAHLLRELGRDEEAQASLDRADDVGGDMARPSVSEMWDAVERATELEAAGDLGGALTLVSDVIRPWGNAPPPEAAEVVAYASVYSAHLAVQGGPSTDAAVEACEIVLRHYGASDAAGVRAMVLWSRTTKAYALGNAGRYDEAIAACQEAIDLGAGNDNERVQERVQLAYEERERWQAAREAGP